MAPTVNNQRKRKSVDLTPDHAGHAEAQASQPISYTVELQKEPGSRIGVTLRTKGVRHRKVVIDLVKRPGLLARSIVDASVLAGDVLHSVNGEVVHDARHAASLMAEATALVLCFVSSKPSIECAEATKVGAEQGKLLRKGVSMTHQTVSTEL